MTDRDTHPRGVEPPTCLARWLGTVTVKSFVSGSGSVSVWPGAVRVETPGLLRVFSGASAFEKREGKVLIVRRRLAPPWVGTTLYLSPGSKARIAAWRFREAVEKVRQAGFEVEARDVWLSARDDISAHEPFMVPLRDPR